MPNTPIPPDLRGETYDVTVGTDGYVTYHYQPGTFGTGPAASAGTHINVNGALSDWETELLVNTFTPGTVIRRIPGVPHVITPGGFIFNEAPDGAVGVVNRVAQEAAVNVRWVESDRESTIHVSCIEAWNEDVNRPPRWRCAGCGQFQSGLYRRYEHEGRDHCLHCTTTCRGCRNRVLTRSMSFDVWTHSNRCEDCLTRCGECGELFNDRYEVRVGHRGVYHADCSTECGGCGYFYSANSDDLNWVDDSEVYACARCSTYCETCDQYHLDHLNEGGHGGVANVSGYGHTSGSIWYGGPVPRNDDGKPDGYYMGIENEITAHDGDADDVRQWARENLGHWEGMDCKEDSSVEGFEIVTQPMTPEFFESVNWESFFDMLNERFPLPGHATEEPVEHGLHVHIGRVAFGRDPVAISAFCYLIGTGNHMERIGRREPTEYCQKVRDPARVAIVQAKQGYGRQSDRLRAVGHYPGRDAINLGNPDTIEIRAFKSTRSANELRDAVRLVYLCAEYVRHLRATRTPMSSRNLRWTTFSRWVALNHPEGFDSIVGLPAEQGSNRIKASA